MVKVKGISGWEKYQKGKDEIVYYCENTKEDYHAATRIFIRGYPKEKDREYRWWATVERVPTSSVSDIQRITLGHAPTKHLIEKKVLRWIKKNPRG